MRGILTIMVAAVLALGQASFAQRGGPIELHGVPGSVTSPGIDGRPRGVAASVTAPDFTKSLTSQGRIPRSFPAHPHHRPVSAVAVPYYDYYGMPYYDYSDYDQPAAQPTAAEQQASQPQVVVVKEEAADSEQEDSHYGEHSFDSAEGTRNNDRITPAHPVSPPEETTQEQEPPTTLVYRDGHKSEVRNYAIVGSNLIDLTKSPVMKKIPLSSLDLDATRRENDENGVDFHLP